VDIIIVNVRSRIGATRIPAGVKVRCSCIPPLRCIVPRPVEEMELLICTSKRTSPRATRAEIVVCASTNSLLTRSVRQRKQRESSRLNNFYLPVPTPWLAIAQVLRPQSPFAFETTEYRVVTSRCWSELRLGVGAVPPVDSLLYTG
jgi:hypothetical protein